MVLHVQIMLRVISEMERARLVVAVVSVEILMTLLADGEGQDLLHQGNQLL